MFNTQQSHGLHVLVKHYSKKLYLETVLLFRSPVGCFCFEVLLDACVSKFCLKVHKFHNPSFSCSALNCQNMGCRTEGLSNPGPK